MARHAHSVVAIVAGLLGAVVLALYLTAPAAGANGGPHPLPGFLGIHWAAEEALLAVYVLWFVAFWDGLLALSPDFRSRRLHWPPRWRHLWSLVLIAVLVVPVIMLPHTLARLRLEHRLQSSAGTDLLIIAAMGISVGLTCWIAYRLVMAFTDDDSKVLTAEPEQRTAQG